MKLKEIAENHGLTPEGVDYALTQYQIVICEITHGMMSKPSYDARDIIRTAQERWCDTCDLKEQGVGSWISVKDRLPEEGVQVLVWEKHGSAYAAYVNKQVSGVWQIGDTNGAIITHWQPLPEPPEVNKNEAD